MTLEQKIESGRKSQRDGAIAEALTDALLQQFFDHVSSPTRRDDGVDFTGQLPDVSSPPFHFQAKYRDGEYFRLTPRQRAALVEISAGSVVVLIHVRFSSIQDRQYGFLVLNDWIDAKPWWNITEIPLRHFKIIDGTGTYFSEAMGDAQRRHIARKLRPPSQAPHVLFRGRPLDYAGYLSRSEATESVLAELRTLPGGDNIKAFRSPAAAALPATGAYRKSLANKPSPTAKKLEIREVLKFNEARRSNKNLIDCLPGFTYSHVSVWRPLIQMHPDEALDILARPLQSGPGNRFSVAQYKCALLLTSTLAQSGADKKIQTRAIEIIRGCRRDVAISKASDEREYGLVATCLFASAESEPDDPDRLIKSCDFIRAHDELWDINMHLEYYEGDDDALLRAPARKLHNPKPRDVGTEPIVQVQWERRRAFLATSGPTEKVREFAHRLPEDGSSSSVVLIRPDWL